MNDRIHVYRKDGSCRDCGAKVWKRGSRLCDECIRANDVDSSDHLHSHLHSHPSNNRPTRGRHCKACEGLSWRRPRDKACECGKFYRPEDVPRLWG